MSTRVARKSWDSDRACDKATKSEDVIERALAPWNTTKPFGVITTSPFRSVGSFSKDSE